MNSWLKLSILTIICLVIWVVVQLPDGRLHVIFCDVGQGDAELIVKGKVQILIDSGNTGGPVLACLSSHMPFWDQNLEIMVNTHPQKDHVGGLDDVMERYKVNKLLINQIDVSSEDYQKLWRLASFKKVDIYSPLQGDTLQVAGLVMDIWWPSEAKATEGKAATDEDFKKGKPDLNELSIVLRLKYGKFTAAFTGDIGEADELAMVGGGLITNVTVLKVPHHGSKYSSSEEFVAKLRPKLAVIEVGAKNNYGHPNGDIMKRFDVVGAKLMRTDLNGTVEVVTDGSRWWVSR